MIRYAAGLAVVALLAACGSAEPSEPPASGGGIRTKVVASFYPLQYLVERVGGDAVQVSSLTKAGAEPHDLELTPKDVAGLSDAKLVVYLMGFQAAVDAAVSDQARDTSFDAAPSAQLDLTYTPVEEGERVTAEAGATDPHFWLDPVRLQAVAAALSMRMSQVDPSHATAFATNTAALRKDLGALDRDLRSGLAHCANPDVVTSHNAFGYLSRRYGLTQVGITGLTPDAEPDAGQLAKVTGFVRKDKVRTIYYETLVSPAVAEVVAKETGAATDVLDPIEGLSTSSQGRDYLSIMRANLANLRKGQGCT